MFQTEWIVEPTYIDHKMSYVFCGHARNRNLEPCENNGKLDYTHRKIAKIYCVNFDFLAEDEFRKNAGTLFFFVSFTVQCIEYFYYV